MYQQSDCLYMCHVFKYVVSCACLRVCVVVYLCVGNCLYALVCQIANVSAGYLVAMYYAWTFAPLCEREPGSERACGCEWKYAHGYLNFMSLKLLHPLTARSCKSLDVESHLKSKS